MHTTLAPLLFAFAAGSAVAADLTDTEKRWLTAAAPVLNYARQLPLPIDIIVQPKAGPDDVPLALGFAAGRCKLVLSMRGNPAAEAVLAGVAPERQAILIEAMTAHELGHCWRYAQGVWHALPGGFTEAAGSVPATPALRALSEELRQTRREEGYADLVALAWMQQRHPGRYEEVYQWLEGLRRQPGHEQASHATEAWLRLAESGRAFAGQGTAFEQAYTLWQRGLGEEE